MSMNAIDRLGNPSLDILRQDVGQGNESSVGFILSVLLNHPDRNESQHQTNKQHRYWNDKS